MEVSVRIKTREIEMLIKDISWISRDSAEAEVEISDGNFTCVAFSQPCSANIGETINDPLHVFSLKEAMICESESPVGIWNTEKPGLSRKVIARVINASEHLVAVGGIKLLIDDYLPGGINTGDLIEFKCGRIDLW
jgi:hypothetical protein